MVFKKARLGRDCGMGALNPSPTHRAIHSYKVKQYIVRIEYKANNIGGIISGAGVADTTAPPPRRQGVTGSIFDESQFFFIVDFYISLSGFQRLVFKKARMGRDCTVRLSIVGV